MNLILCSHKCIHQKEGYCCLDGTAVVTNASSASCCYYEAAEEKK